MSTPSRVREAAVGDAAVSAARVSIGLPVYNGEAFVAEAVRSVLDQTYRDIELIISDNASSDRTVEICEEFAAWDDRVTVLRAGQNVGASANFNRTVAAASGEYFKWIAHDDVIGPRYLEMCVERLDADPSIVLCQTGVRIIDSGGRPIREYDPHLDQADSTDVARRFADLAATSHRCLDVFGLIRSDALSATHLIAPYIASDRTLLVELALRGRFCRLSEIAFFSREHDRRSIRAMPLHQRAAWFDPNRTGRYAFPHFRLWLEYMRLIAQARLTARERLDCAAVLAAWIPRERRRLLRDLRSALRTAQEQFVGS